MENINNPPIQPEKRSISPLAIISLLILIIAVSAGSFILGKYYSENQYLYSRIINENT